MPGRIEHYGGLAVHGSLIPTDGIDRLDGYLTVYALAFVVMVIYGRTYVPGFVVISAYQQIDGGTSLLHPPGGIDARTYLEHHVIYGDYVILQTGKLYYGEKSLAGMVVQFLQPVEGQYSVLSGDGDQVGSYAYSHQIQKFQHFLERYVMSLGIGLNELESHSAPGQFIERIVAVIPLGIQNGDSGRQHVIGQMMVTYYEIHPFRCGVFHLLHSLYAAVQGDDQSIAVRVSPVDSLI